MNNMDKIRRGEGLNSLSDSRNDKYENEYYDESKHLSYYEKYWWLPSAISVIALIISLIEAIRP